MSAPNADFDIPYLLKKKGCINGTGAYMTLVAISPMASGPTMYLGQSIHLVCVCVCVCGVCEGGGAGRRGGAAWWREVTPA